MEILNKSPRRAKRAGEIRVLVYFLKGILRKSLTNHTGARILRKCLSCYTTAPVSVSVCHQALLLLRDRVNGRLGRSPSTTTFETPENTKTPIPIHSPPIIVIVRRAQPPIRRDNHQSAMGAVTNPLWAQPPIRPGRSHQPATGAATHPPRQPPIRHGRSHQSAMSASTNPPREQPPIHRDSHQVNSRGDIFNELRLFLPSFQSREPLVFLRKC